MTRRTWGGGVVLPLALATLTAQAGGGGGHEHHEHHATHGQGAAASGEDHSAHMKMTQTRGRYTRSYETYAIPELSLLDQHGQPVRLADALDSEDPVALNFIFTTCTTICPVMSATFAKLRRELADDTSLRMVSISIDPEHDTPPVLKQYADTYGADARWSFLTGTTEDITETLRAFDALTGSKMNHRPLTFFRVPGEEQWLRIDGLTAAARLADEYRTLRND